MQFPHGLFRRLQTTRTQKTPSRTVRRAAKESGITISTITLWRRPPAPQAPPKQRKTRKISAQALLEDVGRYPDAYCCERAQRFGCSHTAIHKALKRYGISCKKKTNRHPKAGRRLRKNFLKLLHRYIRRNRPVVCSDGS
ncbi:IS630 transposase-related protein [Neisseria weixii]|uniref:IS630 transposase-related protein n=1 Tax=Neisseria weixii TaxID=1853276 RepID=UPI00361F5B96